MCSSAWRETAAVLSVLKSLASTLCGNRVKWFTDNQSVVSIVTKGSMKSDLQRLALQIYSVCLGENISLEVEWIPRTQNEKAHFLSKLVDVDDWAIGDHVFQWLD